ncbi:MAG: uridine kinase [Cellvibrionaceae bacterium]|nr:uridine kinase [Cellvibrionaceae bacterium]
MNATIILISGPSGSGKSSISQALGEHIRREHGADCINIIQEDNYYRRQDHKAFAERCEQNYDHPSAFEHELLLQHLKQLQQGLPVQVPLYDFSQHNRSQHTQPLAAAPIILVEGIMLLSQAALRQHADLSIYVDTPMDICLIRRLKRDIQQRGRDMDSVLSQYQQTVRPMAEQYVLPSRQHADMVLSGTSELSDSLKQLTQQLQAHLPTR